MAAGARRASPPQSHPAVTRTDYLRGTHVLRASPVTEPVDPYPWRPEAVRLLREQRRFEEANAILTAACVWQPEGKSVEQWMALGAHLVLTARREAAARGHEANEEDDEDGVDADDG